MGKADDKEEPEEDEPDPVQAGRLSNRQVRIIIVLVYIYVFNTEMLLI